jgi:hypothetical protein
MHPDDLARLVDRELKRLPAPRAPESLLPRVLTAVRARPARPALPGWWARWPVGVRALAAAAVVAVLAGASWWGPAVEARFVAALAESAVVRLLGLIDLWRQAEGVTTAAEAIWRLIVQPLSWLLLPLVLLMWFACAAFGAALDRVALGGATQS